MTSIWVIKRSLGRSWQLVNQPGFLSLLKVEAPLRRLQVHLRRLVGGAQGKTVGVGSGRGFCCDSSLFFEIFAKKI